MKTSTCIHCGKSFTPHRQYVTVVCSEKCRVEYAKIVETRRQEPMRGNIRRPSFFPDYALN
jgi:predicted nucleic acid-binding Zn ribbon protein